MKLKNSKKLIDVFDFKKTLKYVFLVVEFYLAQLESLRIPNNSKGSNYPIFSCEAQKGK